MPIKFSTSNSNISVDTFVNAPETAHIDISINNSEVNANTMFYITNVDSLYTRLGVGPETISPEQVALLIDKIDETQRAGGTPDSEKLLTWVGTASAFATLIGSPALITCISSLVAIVATTPNCISHLKSLFK